MKHLAKIQKEFVKCARLFEEMTVEQQQQYLSEHPRSTKQAIAQGNEIADKLGIYFNGYQPEVHSFWFTDYKTGSSFMAKNLEHAELKLQQMRQKFENVDVSTQQVVAAISARHMKRIAHRLIK